MTEITDLSVTDSSNTTVTGESIDGAIANMGRMDNTLQAILGLLARSIRTNVLRFLDNADPTKQVALDLTGLSTGATRTYVAPNKNGTLALLSDVGATSPSNLALAASVGASALTISIKGNDGNDPSASNPVTIPFRNVTEATGTITSVTLTAATSLVISSGSTLGFSNGISGRIWIVAFNDAGTVRIGAINCLSGVTQIFPLYEAAVASSTAEGGAGGADNAQVFYTGTTVTSKAYTILGYFEWASGLATAGTWSIVPTRISLFSAGGFKPGDIVQTRKNATGAANSGTTVIPFDDTVPTDTEGDEYLAQAITPRSAANLLVASFGAHLSNSASPILLGTVCRDTTTAALTTSVGFQRTVTDMQRIAGEVNTIAGSTSSTTFKFRAGGSVAGTTTFNGQVGARVLGGSLNSYLRIDEVMA